MTTPTPPDTSTSPVASSPPELTVYYDGACPLCSREIGFYQACRGSAHVAWVDVSKSAHNTVAPDLTKDAALARFHVRDANGALISGGDAFAALWRILPAWRWAGRIFQIWPLTVLINVAYRVFLPLRPWLQRMAKRS